MALDELDGVVRKTVLGEALQLCDDSLRCVASSDRRVQCGGEFVPEGELGTFEWIVPSAEYAEKSDNSALRSTRSSMKSCRLMGSATETTKLSASRNAAEQPRLCNSK